MIENKEVFVGSSSGGVTTEQGRGIWNVPVTCVRFQPQPPLSFFRVDCGVPAGPLLLTQSCSTMALTSSVPALLPTPQAFLPGLLEGSWRAPGRSNQSSVIAVFLFWTQTVWCLLSTSMPFSQTYVLSQSLGPGSPLCAMPSCLGPLGALELTRAAFMCCLEGSHSNLNC